MAMTSRRVPNGDGEGDDISTTTGHSVTFIGDVYEEDYPREAVGGAPQRSEGRPAAIAGRQDGRRADAETINDLDYVGPYEGAKGREDVSVQGDTPRQTGSINRYDATIANSTSGRECVASDGVGGNGDISQPATGGGVEVVDDGDAPLPFHHRGTGSNAPAPQPNGRPEIIQEDGPPMHHSEIEAAADDKSKPAKERGVEIIEDEEPAPTFCPPNNAGDAAADGRAAEKEPFDNAYFFLRYLLWVITGIPPPPIEEANEERHPAAIPARSTQNDAEGSMEPPHHVLEARLVDEEAPEFVVTYTYQPTDATTSTPVYDAYPMGEEGGEEGSKEEEEPSPLPCWKRYERSACFVRALLLCILAICIAVGLTVNRQSAPSSEPEQAQENPRSPTNPAAPKVMACVCSLSQDDFDGSHLLLEGTHRCHNDDSLAYEQAQRTPSFSMCVYQSTDAGAANFDIEEVSMRHMESDTLWDANLTTSVSIDESYLVTEKDSGNATVKTMVLTPLPPVTEIFSTISTPASFGGTLEVAGEVSIDDEESTTPQTRQLTTTDTAMFQLSIDLLPSSTNNPGNGPSETPSLQPVATDPTTSPAFPSFASDSPSRSPSASPVESDSNDEDSDPPCTNTIGFVDMYGDGCGYYEADPNYPLFCESYGANGPAGNTPNEHCCVCKQALEAKGPTGAIATPKPAGESTEEPSSKPTTPLTPLPSREPSAQPTKQFILMGTTSPSARPTGEPSSRPADQPTKAPSSEPTASPSARPSREPTNQPTKAPSSKPTAPPASSPMLSGQPTSFPSTRPTSKPTEQPTKSPSSKPTSPPTRNPTREPSDQPTEEPSSKPTVSPSARPTSKPTDQPTKQPIDANPPTSPSQKPADTPTPAPSKQPTNIPTQSPSPAPTQKPSESPTPAPSKKPTDSPTRIPTQKPTDMPTQKPTQKPTDIPTHSPSKKPTAIPTQSPSPAPTKRPTDSPTRKPTQKPTDNPTFAPSKKPTDTPTVKPTQQPTKQPTNEPTADPLQQLVTDEAIVPHSSNENVAISGDTAVVGAPLNGVGGKAFVFVKVSGAWVQQQTLEAPFPGANDNFGRSVDIDGDYIVVSAHGDNANSGAAHVFFRSGSNWSHQLKLVPPGAPSGCIPLISCLAVPNDNFGYSVAISGGTILVGASGRDIDAGVTTDNAGAAYVYDKGGAPNEWSQTRELRHPNLTPGALFGSSVDIDGDYAIFGAEADNISGDSSGSAHIFLRNNVGIWSHQDTLLDPLGSPGDLFGFSVDIHEGRAVVGALSDENGNQLAGSIHVFIRSGAAWFYTTGSSGICRPTGSDSFDLFGHSVAVHGSQVVVGVPYGGENTGTVRRFDWGGGGSCFTSLKTLTAPDASPLDTFGMSVAIDSGIVIIGSQDSAYVLSSL